MWRKYHQILLLLLIFITAFLIYFLSNLHPLDWYRHYVFLADAFVNGRVDVVNLPEFYQDVVSFSGKKFLPFAPFPAIFLAPLVAIFGTDFPQVRVAQFVGAVNAVLAWLIIGKLLPQFWPRLLLTLGFSLGTVHFYAATTGTTWFLAHIFAVLFLLVAILELFGKKRPAVLGLLVGLAFLSREPTILSAPFFIWPFLKERQFSKIISFSIAILPAVLFLFFYNFVRFGNIFETGYGVVYNSYINSGIKYSFLRNLVPETFTHFGQFDIRNIPLHFYTIFFMLPDFSTSTPFLIPSKYGMSILLTSPFLVYSVFARNNLIKICWATILLISIPILLHFTQGWVQFGYRFVLDFLPFLLILVAFGFEKGSLKLESLLVGFSILVNFWGSWWARTHGW